MFTVRRKVIFLLIVHYVIPQNWIQFLKKIVHTYKIINIKTHGDSESSQLLHGVIIMINKKFKLTSIHINIE